MFLLWRTVYLSNEDFRSWVSTSLVSAQRKRFYTVFIYSRNLRETRRTAKTKHISTQRYLTTSGGRGARNGAHKAVHETGTLRRRSVMASNSTASSQNQPSFSSGRSRSFEKTAHHAKHVPSTPSTNQIRHTQREKRRTGMFGRRQVPPPRLAKTRSMY